MSPNDIRPSADNLKIECLLNPGVFRFNNKICMLLRVAERPVQEEGFISFPIYKNKNGLSIMKLKIDDPNLNINDARVIEYKGENYLTTRSHLQIVFSDDGINFYDNPEYGPINGFDSYSSFGIEDCRVVQIVDTYYLTYTVVSPMGVAVGMSETKDWKNIVNHGLIFHPHNKDCAIFNEKINNKYYAFHRPSSLEIGGNYMWIASSLDLIHWGEYKCIAMTRKGKFDSVRLGAGAAPIKTKKGWLSIYHGATEKNRYCLGALLLDLNDPSKVIARSEEPIMEPTEEYELTGFWGEVIFTNGHLVDNDKLTIYYGAADNVICAASASITEILNSLK